jgi:hypothetical protein
MDHLNLVDSVTAGGLGYGAGIDDLDTTAASTSRPVAKKRRAGGTAATAATSASATPAASTGPAATVGAATGEDESSSEDGPARPSRRRKAHAVRPRAGYVSESSTTPPPTAAAAASGGSGAASGSGTAGGAAGAEGKVDIEDGVAYCYCAGPSYGEMIGCDSEECEREWVRFFLWHSVVRVWLGLSRLPCLLLQFHLECLQLSSPPEGTWYCPTCQKEKDDEAAAKKGKGGRAPIGGGVKRRV